MPVYTSKGKTYDIPEDKVNAFLAKRKDAKPIDYTSSTSGSVGFTSRESNIPKQTGTPVEKNLSPTPYSPESGGIATFSDGETGYVPKMKMPQVGNINSDFTGPLDFAQVKSPGEMVSDARNHLAPEILFDRSIKRYEQANDLLNSNTLIDEKNLPPIARDWLEKRKVPVEGPYIMGGGRRTTFENTPEDIELVRRYIANDPEGQFYYQDFEAQKKEVDNAIDNLKAKIDDYEKNAPKTTRSIYVQGSPTIGGMGHYVHTEAPENYRDIETARSQLQELERLQKAYEDRDEGGIRQFFNELGRRSGDAAINAGTLGLSRLLHNRNINKTLSDPENELSREAFQLLNQYQALHSADRSIAQDIARGVTDNADFIAQFAATGGIASFLTKGTATAIANRLGGKIAANAVGKMTESVANAFVRTALMPSTLATAYEINTQNPGSFLDAYSQSFWQTFIENFSEGLGEFMPASLRFLGKENSLANRIGRYTGFQGIIPEFAEEQFATIFHSAAGNGQAQWSDLIDPRNQIVTLGTIAAMQMPYVTINAGGYAAGKAGNIIQKRSLRKGYKSNLRNLNALFGAEAPEIIQVVNQKLDTDSEGAVPALINVLAEDGEISDSQKDAVGKYALSYLAYSGLNKAKSEEVQQATKGVVTFINENTNPATGTVMFATIAGQESPVQITYGNIRVREDGSIDYENSDKEIYYLDSEGNKQVTPLSLVESMVENIPAEEATIQATEEIAAPIIARQENEEVRSYEIGESVRFSMDENTSNFGEITGTDNDTGKYLVALLTPNGISQMLVEPRQIINEDNIRDIENGSSVSYIDSDGNTITGIVDDAYSLRNQGAMFIDGEVVPISNVVGLTEQIKSTIPEVEQSTEAASETPAREWEELSEVPLDKNGNPDFTRMSPIMLGSQLTELTGSREEAYAILLGMQEEKARQIQNQKDKRPKDLAGLNKYQRELSRLQQESLLLDRALSQFVDIVEARNTQKEIHAIREENAGPDPDAMTNRNFISQAYPNGAPNLYMQVLFDIIRGQRFVWDNKGNKRGIAEELGKSGENAHRQSYFGILASPENGGAYFDDYVHDIYTSGEWPGMTDAEIRDVVIEALNNAPSSGIAAQIVKDIYAREINNNTTSDYYEGKAEYEAEQAVETIEEEISRAESETDVNPTEAQKEAGNYKKGKVTIHGFDISIENPKGAERSGIDENGNPWSVTMNNTYGYIRKTEGKDGEQIDVFLGNNPESQKVFVVDQVNPITGAFDEHKVMLGFDSAEEARDAYLSNYEEGWQGLGNITEVDVETFRNWADSETRRIKPFAEYKEIQDSFDDAIPFQSTQSHFKPIGRRKFNSLINRLKKTGLAKDVVTEKSDFDAKLSEELKRRDAVMRNERGDIYGFVTRDGIVYLDSSRMNANTPIHEFGHLWNSFIKENNPELWSRGAELVHKSEYWQHVNENPAYANLSQEQKIDEALAMAIGNKGADVVTESGIKTWLSDVWNWVKSKLGLANDVNIEDMTLSDFTDLAVGELLSGEKLKTPIEKARNEVLNLFHKAISGEFKGKPVSIGKLTEEGKQYLSDISGLDFREYTDFMISPSDLNHIYKDHYGDNEKDKGQNNPLTDEDIKSMVDVISVPDRILFLGYDEKTQSNKFTFLKKNPTGTYRLVEVYGKKGGTLTAKSFLNSKKDIDKITKELNPLFSTSETNFDLLGQRIIEFDSSENKDNASSENEQISKQEISEIDGDVRFQSVSDVAKAAGSSMTDEVRNELDNKLKSFAFRLREAWEDKHLAVKNFLNILRENGTEVAEYNDFHKQATHVAGRIDAQLGQYQKSYQDPLNEAIGNLQKVGLGYRDIENYVILKHGLERNEWMRQDAVRKYKETHPEATPEQIERFEDNLSWDYSGITAVQEEAETTAENFIEQFEQKAGKENIDNLWKRTKAATSFALKKQLEGGLIDKATLDELTSRYKYYIPLRGHDAETAEDRWDYSPNMGTYFVAPLVKAKGRKTRSESPFAYISSMAQSAINSANRNILNQTILRLARKDKSGLLSANKAWYVESGRDAEGIPTYEIQSPVYSENPEQYRQNIEEFEERMQKLADTGMAFQSGKKLDIGGLFIKRNQADQHEVHVYQNGAEYVVYINANPAVARAITGTNAKDLHKNLKWIANVSRQMAANFTTRNPVFVLSNFSRDYIFASSILPVKEGAGYALQFQKNMPVSGDALQRYVRGKADLSKKQDRYLNEYIMNGGKTGFSHILELQKIQKQIERDIKNGGKKRALDYTVRPVLNALESMNEVAENMSRLSVYITSREQGRSIIQSISDAKEVTVNFNRSGAGGMLSQWVRPLYLFVNAGIQALSNFSKVAAKNPGKAAALIAGYAATGFLMPFVSALLGGDDGEDEYWKLSDWERQNNLCIYTGSGFIKIPLPHELRVFHKMGDEIFQATKRGKDVTEMLINTSLGFADLIPANPFGAVDGSWAEMMPDALKPVFQLAANRNFTGSRITNEWADKNKPGYLRVRTNKKGEAFAPAFLVKLAEGLDNMTGGDGVEKGLVSLNPDVINHIMRGYFGGLYTMTSQGLDAASKAYDWTKTGELKLKVRETPLRTFYSSSDDLQTASSGLNSKYFKIDDDVKEILRKEREYKKQVTDGKLSIGDFAQKMQKLNVTKANELNAKIKQIKKYEGSLKELDGPEQKELERIIANLKGEVVEMNNNDK